MEDGSRLNRSGERYKPSVRRRYESAYKLYLDRPLGAVKVTDLKRRDVQALVDRLRATLRPSTVRNAVMPLRAIYRHLLARDVVTVTPLANLELPAVTGKREEIVTPEQAAAMIDCLPTQDQAPWSVMFYGGLRLGEVQALTVENIDLAKGVIHVESTWDRMEGTVGPKSKAGNRTVPIPSALRGPLAAHLLQLEWDKGLAFGRKADDAFRPYTLTDRAYRAWEAAGLDRITPHEARHTYASLMIAAGVNAKVLSSYMGHSSITETLDGYGHLMPGNESEAADLLDAYLDRFPAQEPAHSQSE
jgi:integrase